MSAFALFGLGFGPIVATQLLAVAPSWRWVFLIVALPGLVVAALTFFIIREPEHLRAGAQKPPLVDGPSWLRALRSRNLILATLCLLCAMTGIFVISAMAPSYLTDFLRLNVAQMGFVVSGLGFGGFIGEFALGAISDVAGRKMTVFSAFAAAAGLLFVFSRIGPSPGLLFALLFATAFFCFGLLALLTGPIATEAVSPLFASSAIGIVSGVGEIFGGGVAPAAAGFTAQRFGIQHVIDIALAGLLAGAVLSLFLAETAPSRIAAKVKV